MTFLKNFTKIQKLHWLAFPHSYNNSADVNEKLETYSELAKDLETLQELKQIEKELGIDLIILFKALKNGIYGTSYGEKLRKESAIIYVEPSKLKLHLNDEEPSFHYLWGFPYDTSIYLFKDYGITWALTKERLENGK